MRNFALVTLLCAAPSVVAGQSAIEHHVWQDRRPFEPISRTASAITGTIRLSGNPEFASPGSKMTITFANGRAVELTSVGASWRVWNLDGTTKETAEVFKLTKDPGKLEQGNYLCSPDVPARFIVFFEDQISGLTPTLTVAAFSSKKAPRDINSPKLCGTYSYSAE